MLRRTMWLCTALLTLGVGTGVLAQAPAYGGTLTVAISADPPGWDPTASTSQEIARVVYGNVFEGLVDRKSVV